MPGRRVTLEYALIADVNDSPADADRLAAIARDLPSKINLIPYNPVPGLPYRRPTPEALQGFAERLYPRAPAVTVRHTQGGEIWAAASRPRGSTSSCGMGRRCVLRSRGGIAISSSAATGRKRLPPRSARRWGQGVGSRE